MFIQMPDGSVVDGHGKVVYFSTRRFIEDIVDGDCCFICGKHPDEAEFNDEHVIPDWVLRRYNLHREVVTLPNSVTVRYDQYKIPCCRGCNAQMGDEIESPMRALVDSGIDGLTDYLQGGDPRLLFVWLTLIFLKTHLKDTELRQHLDYRMGDGRIADAYTWEDLHHLHCVGRSFHTGATLDSSAIGSILVWPAKEADHLPRFDFRDLYVAQTMLLRLGDIALFAVLNDACATINVVQSTLQRLEGPLSPIQLRELLGHCAYVNLNLRERPRFFTNVQPKHHRCEIRSTCPAQVSVADFSPAGLGEVIYGCCQDILDLIGCTDDVELIKAGKWTWLLRDGKFIHDSMDLRQPPRPS